MKESKPIPELIVGKGVLSQLGDVVRKWGGNRILLVTDKGVRQAGHVDRALKSLKEANCQAFVFDEVIENPTTCEVNQCVEFAKKHQIDLIVGLGGGSSLDTAKGCNFILTNGGEMVDYWGKDKATKPLLPFVAIPTTTGTGSECQSYALISDETTHRKMACGDKKAIAKAAILDSELALTQPFFVFACTGIDAIAHALESAVASNKNEYSLEYSRKAFQLLIQNFEIILDADFALERGNHTDEIQKAIGEMQLGAAYAGMAIENSMLGASHSSANPLTATFNWVHGQAVGMMLPHVIRFNAREESVLKEYAGLSRLSRLCDSETPKEKAVECLVSQLKQLQEKSRLFSKLEVDNEMLENSISKLADQAVKEWTAQFNPCSLTVEDFKGLYQKAFDELREREKRCV